MTTYTHQTKLPFSEDEEQELAAELLAVSNDRELDHFLSNLLRRGASAQGRALRSSIGQALGGLAKGAVRKILPDAGRGFDRQFDPAAAGQIGRLAAGAGQLIGMEGEGLSAEDQEFNAATQLIRLAGTAAAEAAASRSAIPSADIAQDAMIQAAQLHAPGLLRPTAQPRDAGGCGCGGSCSREQSTAGSWEKRGRQIILHGI